MERKHLRQLVVAASLIVAGRMLLSFNKKAAKATNVHTGKGKKLSFQVVILNTKALKDLLNNGATIIVFQQTNPKEDATGFIFKKRNRYELTAYVRYKDETVKKNRDILYMYNEPSVKITKTFKTVVDEHNNGMDASFGNIPLHLNNDTLNLSQIDPDGDHKFLVLHPRAGTKKANMDLTGYVVYDVYFASGEKDIDPNDSPEGPLIIKHCSPSIPHLLLNDNLIPDYLLPTNHISGAI